MASKQRTFKKLETALLYMKRNPNCSVYGCVVVNSCEYADDEIHKLKDKVISGWSWGGDQFPQDSNICVVSN